MRTSSIWAIGTAAALILSAGLPTQSAPAQVTHLGTAAQPGTEAFVIHSQHTGRDYLVEVTSPLVNATLPPPPNSTT